MTKSSMIKSLFSATATLALAAGIAAAPVSFDVAGDGISLKSASAFARRGRGADDPAGHVRGGGGKDDGANHKRHGADDPAGHVRGGGGKGRGGKDDGPNHR